MILSKKSYVGARMDPADVEVFEQYVKKSGLSREKYIRTLCSIVTVCDCKPSETCLYKAYREES